MTNDDRVRRDDAGRTSPLATPEREPLLRLLAAATFVIFFQAYMVAPIIPALSVTFGASVEATGSIVPAYLIPYGVATLIFGFLADRLGVRRVMFASFGAFVLLTAGTATARSIEQLALWRMLTGLGASGVVPLALVMVGRQFPYEERGRPLGWLFGAMAGGMAFGSTSGAVLEPVLGWRGLFVLVSFGGFGALLMLWRHRATFPAAAQTSNMKLAGFFGGYRELLRGARGRRTYGYVLLNSMFHSGVFTWLGVYFDQRYGLGPVGIGLALLGYGVPGFLLGPAIGKAADRWGRARLIPIGLALSALGAAALIPHISLMLAVVAVTVLSLGYDMTQPLFAGIVTSLGGKAPGQAMGLNVFGLFTGFGLGSLFFGALLPLRFETALSAFVAVELLAMIAAMGLFRSETPSPR
ncbi:MAG: MFS transporter [Nevskia sp.]